MPFRLSVHQVIIFLMCMFSFSPSMAHEIRPAIVDIKLVDQSQYKLSIKLNLEAMISKVGNDNKDTNDSKNAELYNAFREMPAEALAQEFLLFEPFLLKNMTLSFNQLPQKLEVQHIDIPDVGDLDLARDSILYFKGRIPDDTKELNWQWDKSFGNAVLRVSTEKQPELFSAYLLDGKSSGPVILATSNMAGGDCNDPQNLQKEGGCQNSNLSASNSKWEAFKNYLQVGFVHIVPKGLDHILFVVGLFLLSAKLRPLLIQITTFTLAHSVTLALGIYGIVNVPSTIVEPLIAASIIYVCIENIYSGKLSRWRPLIVFLFGLLHGLGFASVLKEIGMASGNFVTSLVAFNVGVELGQLTVIAACFITVGLWFKDKSWYRQMITIPASVLIAVIASFWLLERTNLIAT